MLFAIIRYILILIYLKTKKSYITGVEKDTNRMQWKVLQFLGKLKRNSNPNQMLNCPLQYKKWHSSKMIYCYWLRASNLVHNDFPMKWLNDIKEIEVSNFVFVSANKSRHIYKMPNYEHSKLFQDKITKNIKNWL